MYYTILISVFNKKTEIQIKFYGKCKELKKLLNIKKINDKIILRIGEVL